VFQVERWASPAFPAVYPIGGFWGVPKCTRCKKCSCASGAILNTEHNPNLFKSAQLKSRCAQKRHKKCTLQNMIVILSTQKKHEKCTLNFDKMHTKAHNIPESSHQRIQCTHFPMKGAQNSFKSAQIPARVRPRPA
jgi:hypothetical protein